ncbi:MAG: serine hydrolase [Burkholderiaceae bacterium]|nr:serine hydrolase [Burkholderiaceae bacterium]
MPPPEPHAWMQGFPPAADRIIRFEDLATLAYPAHKWVYSHWRELVPTAGVRRGNGGARPFAPASQSLANLRFEVPEHGQMSLDDVLGRTDTDGLAVLHDGRLLFEAYRGELKPQTLHRCFSVTKSFVGLLAATLVHEGVLDPARRVPSYLPELEGSGWSTATVRQVMDMTTGVVFNEDYEDPNSDVIPSRTATGSYPRPPGYRGPRSIAEFLPTLRAAGTHGEAFSYVTPNTEVLGWIIQRLTGKPMAELLSERIWQPLGAEEDACIAVDSTGMAASGGGLCTTLRDLARFGELVRQAGRIDGRQVLPAEVFEDLHRGADREAFARAGYDMFEGWSYRSQWWNSHDEHGAIRALGVHGQQVYVAPKAGLVIARFGSQRLAVDESIERLLIQVYRAIAKSV